MNRTDRLLAIVLELQGKKTQRAEDLAATFEISKRTVYRDIQALSEAGVPIVSMPGIGYSLMEDYFLPPLSFTADEAIMLLLGLDVMTHSFDSEYRTAAQSSGRKIAGVLPEAQREKVASLRESLHFISTNDDNPDEIMNLQLLRRALLKNQQVRFTYYGRNRDTAGEVRTVNPYGLVSIMEKWILVGYCHSRQDVRNFRLSRMSDLNVLDAHFKRPPGYDFMSSEFKRSREETDTILRVWFDRDVAQWIHEERNFYIKERELTDDGGVLVTLKVRHERDVLQWVLSWGSHVLRVDSPILQRLIAEEVQKMAAIYEKLPDSLLT